MALTILKPFQAKRVLTYFERNRSFLEPWEPKRDSNFYTVNYQRQYMRLEEKLMRQGEMIRFWLVKKDNVDGDIIGSISMNNIAGGSFQSCQIGYRLDEREAGKGYMTEALNDIKAFAFEELNLHRLELNVIPRNERSLRVAQKAGFTQVGLSPKYLNINGVWEDHVHMAIINDHWKMNIS
jgi:ribosomal-protein-alanine N-acetyltransferase